MNEEVVWINLKILSKIPPYHRLNTQHELFSIEQNSFWNPSSLWRFVRGDNRALAIKRIGSLVEKATLMLDKSAADNWPPSANSAPTDPVYENLLQHLRGAKHGLINLKKTYEDDFTTNASLDRLLDKINALFPTQDPPDS